eukprot:scaffold5653_cov147-Cylindrotheca_fusiformis.AAC.13
MKTSLILISLLARAHAFAPVAINRAATQLNAELPDEMLSDEQKEIREIQKKWREVRLLDREVAQNTLDGEWLEAYNRFYEKYDDDMTRMTEIAEKVQKMIEPPKVEKKTKGQKRRDAYAKKVAREAARTRK